MNDAASSAPTLSRADLLSRACEARRLMENCALCPRNCRVNRANDEAGYCRLGRHARWFREFVHYGVEMELVPAHAIYRMGCNMRCAFCASEVWSLMPLAGERWDAERMARIVKRRRAEGASSLLFVGGEPTLSIAAVLDLLAALPAGHRVVWDTNAYASDAARDLLRGVVDVYVADLKFGNDRCALDIADAPNYMAEVLRGLRFAEETASLIVRHLLLPGHLDCCVRPALEALKRNLGRPRLALHGDYLPAATPADPRLAAEVRREEVRAAVDLADEMQIERVE
jgi:putative pyruvate formate lyase activating enzyme